MPLAHGGGVLLLLCGGHALRKHSPKDLLELVKAHATALKATTWQGTTHHDQAQCFHHCLRQSCRVHGSSAGSWATPVVVLSTLLSTTVVVPTASVTTTSQLATSVSRTAKPSVCHGYVRKATAVEGRKEEWAAWHTQGTEEHQLVRRLLEHHGLRKYLFSLRRAKHTHLSSTQLHH